MKKVLIQLFVAFFLVLSSPLSIHAEEFTAPDVGYQSSVSEQWQDFAFGGALSGSENGEALTSIALHLVDPKYDASIEYRVYSNGAWQAWSKDFEPTATGSFSGLQVRLVNYPNTEIHYQTYRKGLGWGSWVYNGRTSGNLSAPITGLRVKIFEVGVKYQSSVNGTLQVVRHNGETQGTGKLDSIRMGLEQPLANASLVYRVYFRNQGWSVWAKNWETLSSNNVVEGIEAKIEGNSYYHVALQAYVKDSGWLDWVYDGVTAGAPGTNQEITAYRVKLLRAAPSVAKEDNEFGGIGEDPGTTNLTYSADEYAYFSGDYEVYRELMNYPSSLTVDGVFDDNPAGVSVRVGDQFTGPVINYTEGNHINVPDTFDGFGNNTVDDEQFEVFYGSYVNGIFTVISTPYQIEVYYDWDGLSESEILFRDEFDSGETHTLILYDNDTRYFVEDDIYYHALGFSDNMTSITIDGQTYTITFDGNVYYIEGYTIDENGIITASAESSIQLSYEGSNMIVDGFIIVGTFYEEHWGIDSETVNNVEQHYMYYDSEIKF